MSDTLTAGPTGAAGAPSADPRRWRALVFIGMAQLMVVLDGTIMNIALPSVGWRRRCSRSGADWSRC